MDRIAGVLRSLVAFALLALPLGAQPTPSATPAPREVPVLWLIGQSNAEGATAGYWLANPLTPGNLWVDLASQDDVHVWWPGPSLLRPLSAAGWERYRVGSLLPVNNGSFYIIDGLFGPEASLGAAARERFGEVFVFKFTWIAPLDPRASRSWSKRHAGWGGYDAAFAEWQRAVRELDARGLAPDLRGIVWVHGEGDCFSGGHSDALAFAREYARNLTDLIDDLRADLRGDTARASIPFAIVELHDRHEPRASWQPGETLVRAAQVQVAATVPDTALVPTGSLGVYQDQSRVHFDPPGSIRLGFAAFDALSAMLR